MGVGHLLLVDFDKVELSNLNRQYYFLADVGRYKAQTLAERLRQINPYGDFCAAADKITPQNLVELFSGCAIICEALDNAEAKAMLVNGALSALPQAKIVAGSGVGGLESGNKIATRKVGRRFYICGDVSAADAKLLCGARVGLCAAHQALTVVRLLLNLEED